MKEAVALQSFSRKKGQMLAKESVRVGIALDYNSRVADCCTEDRERDQRHVFQSIYIIFGEGGGGDFI